MRDEALEAKVAALAARSAEREQERLARHRSDAAACGFGGFVAAFRSEFGRDTEVVVFGKPGDWHRPKRWGNWLDTYVPGDGVPASSAPPPLKRGRK